MKVQRVKHQSCHVAIFQKEYFINIIFFPLVLTTEDVWEIPTVDLLMAGNEDEVLLRYVYTYSSVSSTETARPVSMAINTCLHSEALFR